jgi:hypothetical protein
MNSSGMPTTVKRQTALRWYQFSLRTLLVVVFLAPLTLMIFLQITGWRLADLVSGEQTLTVVKCSQTGNQFAITQTAGPDTEYSWFLKYKSKMSANWTTVSTLACDNYRLEPGWATMTYDSNGDVLFVSIQRDEKTVFVKYRVVFDGSHSGILLSAPEIVH